MKWAFLFLTAIVHIMFAVSAISVVPPIISDSRVPMHCGIYENRELLTVVERICEMCHETYFEVYPQMKSDCRYGTS